MPCYTSPVATRARSSRWLDRAFVRAIFVALLIHLPLAPTRLMDWLRVAFLHGGDYDDADAAAIVPIDLDLLAREPAPEPVAPAPSPPPAPPDRKSVV